MSCASQPTSNSPSTVVPTAIKRLHWGCGGSTPAGWLNSDIKAGPGIDLSCDIRQGLPLEERSVDYIVSVHALQEIPLAEIVPALAELRRVLRPGGVLRLVLPDLLKGVSAYQRGDRDYFMVPDEDARSLGAKLVVQLIWYGYSRTLFTAEFIEEMLLKGGFARVAHCGYQQTESEFPDIVSLDNRENESLFVEAFK
jgi:predicted SAM-dependent methyltransferase